MYCHNCGLHLGEAANFCPRCGADQGQATRDTGGIATPWIILALILLPPLGLLLMFTSSRWSNDTKWWVGGLFFAPLWTRFLWRRRWPPAVKVGLLSVLAVAYLLTVAAWTGASAAFWITVLTIIAVVFIVRSKGAQPREEAEGRTSQPALRAAVRAKLDSCHDLIAQIEGNTVLDLFPLSSPARQRYVQALELRAGAMDLYERANNERDLRAADARANEALRELTAAQDALWSGPDAGNVIPPP